MEIQSYLCDKILRMDKIKLILILSALLSLSVNAQQSQTYRHPVEDNLVPKTVRANFKTQYPRSLINMWYTSHITYWYEDYATGWYGGWYASRPVVVYKFEFPSYYEVDFYRNNENCRAIYNRYGVWFETRTKLIALPDSIADALRSAGYGDWTWSQHIERIEAPGMPGYVYRLRVNTGRESQIIRLNEEGEIIQIRYD